MEAKERTRVMDEWRKKPPLEHPLQRELEAINECDKLARAWDALEGNVRDWVELAKSQGMTVYYSAYQEMQETMRKLLAPPPPKDPLEELEEWAKKSKLDDRCYTTSMAIDKEALLAEIRRLKEGK